MCTSLGSSRWMGDRLRILHRNHELREAEQGREKITEMFLHELIVFVVFSPQLMVHRDKLKHSAREYVECHKYDQERVNHSDHRSREPADK